MFRRDFLRNVGLLGAVVAAPAGLANAQQNGKPDLNTTLLKGRVLSNNKGVASVAVTDGVNITQTNVNGEYSLLSNKTTKLVYFSLPAGYEIPHEKSIAKFYKKIDHNNPTFNTDFVLSKLNGSDDHHAFVVWADTQIISKEDAQQLKAEASPDLKQLAATIQKNIPLHGIGCGDLVWDRFDLLPDYKEAIAITGVPFFNVIGNHDMDINARTDEFSSDTFQENFGPTYYSYNRGKAHYIVLDDVFFVGVNKKYIGYLTENQLSWLDQDLKAVPKGSLIILSLHIPTNTGNGRRNNQKEDDMGGVVMNRKRLYDMLQGYNVHIMSGHTHFNEVWTDKNITEHVHGTVCGAWWTGPVCSDGTPSGYGVYEVTGDKLSWYYKSTGKPASHQLRIYPLGTENTSTGEIVANVWNWDPSWKVEWYENDVLKGVMANKMGLDPWATTLYKGAALPKKHTFVEPTLTDHLFVATPSAAAKKIKVVATDRFGKVYSEEIAV